jgi:flagellar basal body-associated protein FliL
MERSSLMMVVIIVLLVALLGTIVGVAFYAFNMMQNIDAQTALVDRGQVRVVRPEDVGRIPVGSAIITNIVSETGASGRVARIEVVVGYDQTDGRNSEEIARRINGQLDYIRSIALQSIRTHTYEELSRIDAMDNLSEELLEALQNEFNTNLIVAVTFNEWIVQ